MDLPPQKKQQQTEDLVRGRRLVNKSRFHVISMRCCSGRCPAEAAVLADTEKVCVSLCLMSSDFCKYVDCMYEEADGVCVSLM